MLNRIKVIQSLIGATGAKNYLEIGVNNGACFLRVKAAHKTAVDPSFKMKPGRKLKYIIKNPTNVNNKYFEQTSDEFFSTQTEVLATHKPKIVLIDGLHTYEQALRDVINSLKVMDENGIIVMHDCNPVTDAAAHPAESIDHAKSLNLPGWSGVWNGDVWKTIVHLRSIYHNLDVFVLDCDHGLGIVKKGPPKSTLNFTENQIKELTYKHLEADRANLLNLKPDLFFNEFLAGISPR